MGPLSGSRAWLVQRVSAVYLLCFLVYALVRIPAGAPWTYETWHAWLASPAMSVGVLLLFVALLLHAWIGLRDVILDYGKPFALRTALLGLVAVAEVAIGAWVVVILFGAR
jgi:succinate dehydrogenase / fumarate reductase membrane anchor subunit